MAGGGDAHDAGANGNGQDLGAVDPGDGVDEAVVADDKQVDTEQGESLADAVVGVLEFPLHDGAVDLGPDDPGHAGEQHLAAAPAVRQEEDGDGGGQEGAGAPDGSEGEDRVGRDAEGLVERGCFVSGGR